MGSGCAETTVPCRTGQEESFDSLPVCVQIDHHKYLGRRWTCRPKGLHRGPRLSPPPTGMWARHSSRTPRATVSSMHGAVDQNVPDMLPEGLLSGAPSFSIAHDRLTRSSGSSGALIITQPPAPGFIAKQVSRLCILRTSLLGYVQLSLPLSTSMPLACWIGV